LDGYYLLPLKEAIILILGNDKQNKVIGKYKISILYVDKEHEISKGIKLKGKERGGGGGG